MNPLKALLSGAMIVVPVAACFMLWPRGVPVPVPVEMVLPAKSRQGQPARLKERNDTVPTIPPSAGTARPSNPYPAAGIDQPAPSPGLLSSPPETALQISQALPPNAPQAAHRKSRAHPDMDQPAPESAAAETPNGTDPVTESGTGEDPLPLTVPFSPWNPLLPADIPAALAAASPDAVPDPASPPGLDRMTDEFLTKVSQGSQDPRDPAYQQLWDEAQTLSDSRMKAAYGDAVWLKRHQEAYRQALGNAVPAAQENTAPRAAVEEP